MEKLKYKKVGGHAAEDQNKIRTSIWLINEPSRISPLEVYSRAWLINTVYHLLVKNYQGRGGEGREGEGDREGGLFKRGA